MKIWKNPIAGIILGIAFMVLGIFCARFPEYSLSGYPTAVFLGAGYFIVGLCQVLYIVIFRLEREGPDDSATS